MDESAVVTEEVSSLSDFSEEVEYEGGDDRVKESERALEC